MPIKAIIQKTKTIATLQPSNPHISHHTSQTAGQWLKPETKTGTTQSPCFNCSKLHDFY